MKLAIDQIRIDEEMRIRKDVGNISSLEQSIGSVGLINPLLIDEGMNLLAGFRRYTACKNLGWKEIEVRMIELQGDQLKMLDVEIAENFYRKDFTPEEILASEKRRNEILEQRRPKGLFERFWLWLKRLFGNKSAAGHSVAEQKNTDKIGAASISISPPTESAAGTAAEHPAPSAGSQGPTSNGAVTDAEQKGTSGSGQPQAEPSGGMVEETDQTKEK